MKKLTKNNHLKITVLATLLTLLTACGGGDDSGGGKSEDIPVESNPDFISKAKSVNFSRIQLYEGHVKQGDRGAIAELDTSNLSSGDLITVDVEFEITGGLKDYSLAIQLVPQSIFSVLDSGDTIGEVVNENADALKGEGLIDLGGVYIDEIQPGLLHGVVHAKLPVLAQDTVYKVAVTPLLQYLSSGKEIIEAEIKSVPVLFDDRELVIRKLEEVAVKIKEVPDLTVDNDFTQLEIGGEFDVNGFSIEPVFQTSVEVDITTFNDSEEVVLSLTYAAPSGNPLPLGLLSSDDVGDPVIDTEARFVIERTGATSVTIPVVAYATIETQKTLLKQSTNIRDIADSEVETGEFNLAVFYTENGTEVSAGSDYRLSIPLVSQDNKFKVQLADDATGFAVLRAGSTNGACLVLPANVFDIDTGLLGNDSTNEITASTCQPSPQNSMLWRYDTATKQIINKVKDFDGNNYCITAIVNQLIGFGSSTGAVTEIQVNKCFQASRFQTGTALSTQKFEFEGNKIKSTKGYLKVESISTSDVNVTVTNDVLAASDFFLNTSGVNIDQDGRLFYVGKFYDRGWGNADLAQIRLSYGGESYVDYMPVLGTTTEGHATLSASLFGASADLLDTRFVLKRYFPKKLSIAGNNSPDVVVGNGAVLKIDVAGFSAIDMGTIVNKRITDTYNPADEVGDVLLGLPGISDQTATPVEFKLNETFLQTTIIVAIIPVTIEGGVDGIVNSKIRLTTPGIGIGVDVKENFTLGGFLNAKLDALVVAAGIEGKVEVIDQHLNFSANAGFNTDPQTPTKLSFDIDSALLAELKLLKGEVSAFVEYRKICFCTSVGKKVRKNEVIYSSDYLFSKDWEVYSGQLNSTVIEY